MSYEATSAAWAYIRHNPGALDAPQVAVLLCLADHLNQRTRQLNPSLATIAKECGCSSRTVQRAVDRLMELGAITRVSGGGNTSNRYALMIDPSQRDHGTRVTQSTGMDTVTTPPSQPDQSPWTQGPTNQERTKKEPAHDAAPPNGGVIAAAAPVLTVVPDEEEMARKADAAMRAVMAQFSKNRRMPA